MFKYFAITAFILVSILAKGQLSASYTDANALYKEGMELYDSGQFGRAKNKFEEASRFSFSQYNEGSRMFSTNAELMGAKSALRGQFPEGEKAILDFYFNHRPHPLAYDAVKELGDLKYNQKRYTEAIDYYNYIEIASLPTSQQLEVLFKKGYAYFVLKEFETAESNFKPILGKDSQYYFSTYYYMAMIHFFNQEYDKAIEYFFIVENYPEYKTRIPYYIAQIYFAEQKYDDIIAYVPAQLNQPGVQNLKELNHILGQTHFLLNQFTQALPYLEFYESQSKKMRKEDFYQLAFTQYQLGYYEKATENFKELSSLPSDLGQFSNNYLADAYLKLDKKEEARVSFKNVMEYDYNLDMEQEATFNYGKLSAELGYDRAAIKALISLPRASRDYVQAQNVLSSLFESSKDYSMVIQTIEEMDVKAPKILKAYQKVILEKGIQLINDGERRLAKQTLLKAAESPVDNYYSAVIYYHIADLYHQEGDFDSSINFLNKYFTVSHLVDGLPSSASGTIANYLQGYNFIKKKEYTNALSWLNEAKDLMIAEKYDQNSDPRKMRMYADLLNRLGDCYFTINNYKKASQNYKLASTMSFPGQDYALFQRSMIQGLQGNFYEKIVLLEDLITKIPNSSFLDDAYFQIGETQLALGNPRGAELAFQKILSQRRSDLTTRALLKLGLIAYNQGDTDQAIKYYENIFKNNPNKTEAQEALVALEEIYIQDLGRAEDFVALVEKSTGYKMSNFERDSLSYVAAQGRFDNGEYIAAIESYTKYIDQYPNGINRLKATYNRAESNTILKNYKKALPDYDRVISVGPSDYYEDAVYKAALITYNDLQQFEEAFNYYSLLSEVTRDELLQYEALVGALRSGYRFGDIEAALVMASKVILHPLANKEDKAMAYFFSGKMNYENRNWDAAQINLEQVIKLVDNENAAESKYLVNDILYQKGMVAKSEAQTLETISNSTAYPYWVAKNLILYAEIMLDRADVFNAKAALEAVIENFPESAELQEEAKSQLALVIAKEKEMNRLEEQSETLKLDTIKGNE